MRTIGSGIFTWCSSERRSGRYGTFVLAPSDFQEHVQRDVHLDVEALRALEGRNVRIALRILESRPSGHAGDQFLKVFPGTPPDVGSVIELAVGHLLLADHSHHDIRYHPTQVGIGTAPSDGRADLWLDPRVLYVLHDQTVELLVEETADPESAPSPLLEQPVEDGVIVNADGETLQLRGEAFEGCGFVTLLPDVELVPGGILITPPQPEPGKRLKGVPGNSGTGTSGN
ncbi:MAG TPA: hypothetical protein VF006_13250 [Longimicrobium sp.]